MDPISTGLESDVAFGRNCSLGLCCWWMPLEDRIENELQQAGSCTATSVGFHAEVR
jgi:hypothetical protein